MPAALGRAQLIAQINAGTYGELHRRALMQGEGAVQALEEATSKLPNDAAVHSNLGNALMDLGRFDDAVASYRRAVKIKPEFAEAHSNLGNALRSLGRFDDAVASCRRALQIKPDFAVAYINLGGALRALGRLDAAVASYRRALEIKPDLAEAHNNLGNALKDQGQLDEALASYRRAVDLKPGYAVAHGNFGGTLQDLKRLDEAVASYRRALQIKPDFAAVHASLGRALKDLGQTHEAIASFRRALEIEPDRAELHCFLGNALHELGQLADAAASYRRAVELAPHMGVVHNNLGSALRDLGNAQQAEASFRNALALNPDYVEAHNNLGIVLRQQNRLAEAELSCRKALEINPNFTAATVLLAELRADKGQFKDAEDLFRRAISIAPDWPEAWSGIASLRKLTSSDSAWLADAQRIAAQDLPARQEIPLRYAIGKYFDDVNEYAQAFANFQRANELKKQCRAKHDRQRLGQVVDLMTDYFGHDWVSQAKTDANPSARPVFIVGMPRSGTSLAEQILASHPAVFGAGELPFWNEALAAYASSAPDRDERVELMHKLSRDYLRLLEDLSADALRVVDKMPYNFLFLGFIHAALPNASIIHMRRNPIDTCLSIYFQPFDIAHSYANDLEDLAQYYTDYLRLMKHWQSLLPKDAMLEVPYERLVEDQEGWSRKMLEFIGLPWDPRCIEFHQTDRAVATRSRWQVRQKISKSSVERWQNYREFVTPLLRLMG